MVFDWNKKEEAIAMGIVERDVFIIEPTMQSEDGVVSGHTFRNFDNIYFEEEDVIENCIFENCKTVSFENNVVKNCKFYATPFIFTRGTEFIDCEFEHIEANGGMLISLEDGEIRRCTFRDITLTGNSYVCDGVGSCWVEQCHFENIRTDRADGQVVFCENEVGKIFKRKQVQNILHEASCTGLEDIIITED